MISPRLHVDFYAYISSLKIDVHAFMSIEKINPMTKTNGNQRPEIMIIDGDAVRTERLTSLLSREGYAVCSTRSGHRGLEICKKRNPKLVLLGFQTAGIKNSGVLEQLAAHDIAPVVLLARPEDMGQLAPALRIGAQQVLDSGCEDREVVRTVEKLARPQGENPGDRKLNRSLIGRSPAVREAKRRLLALGGLHLPLLVSGEGGTGRRHAAHLLHDLRGQRGRFRFAGPDEQIPQPFRHETLFVSDVETLNTGNQLRLLRFVERQEGSPEESGAVVAATTCHPRELAARAGFRQDLADRLSRFSISLPPLRDRLADLPALAEHLARAHAQRLGCSPPPIALPALRILEAHPWPGNVLELDRLMERLVAFSGDRRIDAGLVRSTLSQSASPVAQSRRAHSLRERKQLMELIDATGGNLAEVARRLDLSRSAIIYRAQKHGLLPPRKGRPAVSRNSSQRTRRSQDAPNNASG